MSSVNKNFTPAEVATDLNFGAYSDITHMNDN